MQRKQGSRQHKIAFEALSNFVCRETSFGKRKN